MVERSGRDTPSHLSLLDAHAQQVCSRRGCVGVAQRSVDELLYTRS